MIMKNIFKTLVLAFAIASVSGCATASQNQESKVADQYDFDYMVQSSSINIVQVFDDGKSTFFQLAPDARIPAIFADTGEGFKFTDMEMYGPYIKVPFTSKRFMLKINNAVARVAYVGDKQKETSAPAIKSFAATSSLGAETVPALPVNEFIGGPWGRDSQQETRLNKYSYSDRLRGDTVAWTELPNAMPEKQLQFKYGTTRISGMNPKQFHAMAKTFNDAVQVELTGFDDGSEKENLGKERVEAVANALAASGISRDVIKTKTARSVVSGSPKGVVLGVTITGYKANKYLPQPDKKIEKLSNVVAAKNQFNTIEQITADMKSGKISPADAKTALSKINDVQVAGGEKSKEVIVWNLKVEDANVQNMFARWAKNSGYEVVFNEFPVIPVNGDSTFESKDILTAIEFVLAQSKLAGIEVPAPKLYSDNVIVFGEEASKE